MLVLTRKLDEQILIGDDIKITLIRVRGGSVRIGIDAPRSLRVVRGELGKDSAARNDAEQEEEIDDLAEVFAHPDSERLGRRGRATNRSAVDRNRVKQLIENSELFAGTVNRDGSDARLDQIANRTTNRHSEATAVQAAASGNQAVAANVAPLAHLVTSR